MGNHQDYIESGGFPSKLYRTHDGFPVVEINGVKAKILLLLTDPEGKHYSLPAYARTSDMYFKVDRFGNVIQGRLYVDQRSAIDFDWNHDHTNTSDGKHFSKGTVHVQEFRLDSSGELVRYSDDARYMTDAEIKKYGPLILHYNPHVKFR